MDLQRVLFSKTLFNNSLLLVVYNYPC